MVIYGCVSTFTLISLTNSITHRRFKTEQGHAFPQIHLILYIAIHFRQDRRKVNTHKHTYTGILTVCNDTVNNSTNITFTEDVIAKRSIDQ